MNVLVKSSDHHWEKFGQTDPYFGVLTQHKYKSANLTDESRAEFFKSGEVYVAQVFDTIKQRLYPDVEIKRALDFGCGVGRLIIPLAARAEEVIGVDVSSAMLTEAAENVRESEIKNIQLVKSHNDDLTCLDGKFDLIHSYIVFQHIPPKRGLKLVKRLLNHLGDGGVGVLHFTYAKDSAGKKIVAMLRAKVPLVGNFINLIRGRRFFFPLIEMNSYSLNQIMGLLQDCGVSNVHVNFTNHGGFHGTILYFRKPLQDQ
jgi:ubiquinone/menaquinone biosynthesis C-methylase UbiE